ncbi:hypothetical protein ACLX1H_001740 [Fusarium chlamydosporum]
MSQLLIERACERFRKQLSTGQEDEIQRLKNVDDVRHAIQRVEQQMAARQSLRNFDRLTPFLNAIDRLTKPIDVLCNGTPFMPYAWIFFSSAWGRFEHQFDALIQSIAQTSELIDKEAVALDINLAQEWRQKFLEDAAKQEKRWEAEQRKAVLQWLEVGDSKSYQEDKLDLLRSHCCDGTSQWLTKSKQIRSWLQFNSGHSSLWLHGKPGSDEVDSRQHRELIRTLASFSDAQVKCKIMFSSQNIRTISSLLDSKPQISLSNESESVAKDIDLFVTTSLEELNDTQDCAIRQTTLARIRKLVLEKAEGIFMTSSTYLGHCINEYRNVSLGTPHTRDSERGRKRRGPSAYYRKPPTGPSRRVWLSQPFEG